MKKDAVGDKSVRCLLLSDFNVQNLAGYLSNDADPPVVEAEVAPYGQVAAILTDGEAACWQHRPDVAVVWTRPQGVIPGFENFGYAEASVTADPLEAVGGFAALLKKAGERVGILLVPTWCTEADRGLGMLEWRSAVGRANCLARMNLRLAEECSDQPNIFVLDAEKWMRIGGRDAFNAKLWYLAKVPFGNEVFKAAVADIKACLRAVRGESRKLVVVDLDDSLWGGVVGELGWERLRLGGHDGVGEAYRDFQRVLKSLTGRGILLGIASKNEEAVALQAIQNHPEMVLKLDDFAAWRINWGDKAESVVDMAAELNLGLQSVVFIDDNPVERERVSSALPEVLVPDWPRDPFLYASALSGLDCFATSTVTREDRDRPKSYLSQRQRADLKKTLPSVEAWLEHLDTRLTIEKLNQANLARATQLFNKTNQMNLRTRRLAESALMDWARTDHHELWTVRVTDVFGDSGLAGIVSVEIQERWVELVDFILSCRVMGRGIEDALLHTLMVFASSLGRDRLRAQYAATEKNKPCRDFLERSGMAREGDNVFFWNLSRSYPKPKHIAVNLVAFSRA